MAAEQGRKLSILWARMAQNIDENYLELFLITSQAAGREPSEGRPLGAGKSTLGLIIVYRAFAYRRGTLHVDWRGQRIVDETPHEERLDLMREVVEKYTVWSLGDLLSLIKKTPKRLPAVLWDDVQLDCPSWQHIPPRKREMMEELTVARPLVANIVMTAPSISDIAKPLRRQVNWEVIIPSRGVYEVHFIAKRRDFYMPIEDRQRLWYDATGVFEPLPDEIMRLYERRREEVARRARRGGELEDFEERIVEYYRQGLPLGTIASYCATDKKTVAEVLERKGLLR
jgi:hypothetical protein